MTYDEIKEKYLNNEKILWQGAPQSVPLLNKSDIYLIPATILLGFPLIIYAVISAVMMFYGEGIMFSLVGITSLLIGAYILLARLWYRKKRIKKYIYFITEKRIFGFNTMRDTVIFDIPLENIELSRDKNSIYFGEQNLVADLIYNLGIDIFFRKFAKETPAFMYVDNITSVSKILTDNIQIKQEDDNNDSIFI